MLFVQSIGGPAAAKVVRRNVHPLKKPAGSEARSLLAEVQTTCSHVLILRAGRQVYSGALADLDPGQQPGRLLVGMNAPPPVTVLERLPRVTQVDELGEGRFRLHHSPGALPQRLVVELAYDCGWDLWELTPEQLSLEQVFFDLTVGQETVE